MLLKSLIPFLLVLISLLPVRITATNCVDVSFRVNMSIQIKTGFFNPANDSVRIAGNFTEWGDKSIILTDLDKDSVYEVTLKFRRGEHLVFKFIMGKDKWEHIENRVFTVPNENSICYLFFNNNRSMPVRTAVTFSANMEYEIAMEKFHPGTDTLTVRGDFNNWSDTDIMHISTGDPNYYEFTDTFYVSENDIWNYKFAYKKPDTLIWEWDLNSVYIFKVDDIIKGSTFIKRTFNNLTPHSSNNDNKTDLFDKNFYLYQNYPNPFNPSTTISFSIPGSEFVSLKVYDILGKEIQILINEEKSPGTYKITFDASSLASGTYIYRINTGKYNSAKKLLLLK